MMSISDRAYWLRLRRALYGSLALHVLLFFAVAAAVVARQPGLPAPPEEEMVRLNLRPPDEVKRLVDTVERAKTAPEQTDLIAKQASKARDLAPSDGKRPAPKAVEADEFEQLARALPMPAEAARPLPPAPEPAPDVPERAQTEAERPPETPKAEQQTPEETAIVPEPAPERAGDEPAPEPEPEPAQVARAPEPRAVIKPSGRPRKAKGRLDGGVKSTGFQSFEAIQHELAAYMEQVRDRVELEWLEMLQMRYTGTYRTRAVLDVAIAPTGRIAAITIVESGSSVTYAPLCKEAVEKAGPFPPFPFDVPPIYRNKNLEIRWTFSYM